jgi:hypothetical protein
MAAIEPPEPRATVVKEPTGLRITIPVKRRWFMLLFLTVCLGFWGVGGGTTLLKTLRGERGDDWLTLAFLAVWVACIVFGVYVWLWQLAGQEVVVLRPRSLLLRREIFGFGRSREFDLGTCATSGCRRLLRPPATGGRGSSPGVSSSARWPSTTGLAPTVSAVGWTRPRISFVDQAGRAPPAARLTPQVAREIRLLYSGQ